MILFYALNKISFYYDRKIYKIQFRLGMYAFQDPHRVLLQHSLFEMLKSDIASWGGKIQRLNPD